MFDLKKILSIVGLFIVGILLGVGLTLLVQHLRGPKQIVSVTGQGVIEVPADQASISVTIQSTSQNQTQAEKDNKQKVQDLKDKLISLGIPESRIIQSSYTMPSLPMMGPGQISPLNPPGIINEEPSPLITGGKNIGASTTLSITVDTLQKIDKIFTVINASPNAKITSTNYSLKSTSKYDALAREKALQDARNQVESIAKINNLHVGKLLFINNNSGPVPIYKVGTNDAMGQAVSNTGVSYGEKTIEITASFNAQYELN